MPFFERLTPVMPERRTVRPALPPRFAAIEPDGAGSPGVPQDPGAKGRAALPDRLAAGSARRVESEVALRLPLPTDDRAPPAPPASPGAAAADTAVLTAPLPPPPVSSGRPAAASGNAVVTAPVLPAVPTITGNRPAAGASGPTVVTTPAAPPPANAEPDASRGAALARVIASIPAALPLSDTGAPRREAGVRQRAVASAGFAATEIQVTIDRIEVRAPAAATGGAARPTTIPRTAPTQSLAEYLRRRPPGRQSGGAG
jgi:hypothetical protein